MNIRNRWRWAKLKEFFTLPKGWFIESIIALIILNQILFFYHNLMIYSYIETYFPLIEAHSVINLGEIIFAFQLQIYILTAILGLIFGNFIVIIWRTTKKITFNYFRKIGQQHE
jgi:hypothetical protein